MTKQELLLQYQKHINNPENNKHQSQICGIFTEDREKALQYMEQYNNISKVCRDKNEERWVSDNGEVWIWRPQEVWRNVRGYRFGKIVVDKNIDSNFLEEFVLVYSGYYCSSMEII